MDARTRPIPNRRVCCSLLVFFRMLCKARLSTYVQSATATVMHRQNSSRILRPFPRTVQLMHGCRRTVVARSEFVFHFPVLSLQPIGCACTELFGKREGR